MDRRPRIESGTVALGGDEFSPKYAKFRVTMWMDVDLLDAVRKRAAADGMKYQPWINKKLREMMLSEARIERRIAALEKAIFKQRAS
jgi:uncharacterized protein (DUF4415 family)